MFDFYLGQLILLLYLCHLKPLAHYNLCYAWIVQCVAVINCKGKSYIVLSSHIDGRTHNILLCNWMINATMCWERPEYLTACWSKIVFLSFLIVSEYIKYTWSIPGSLLVRGAWCKTLCIRCYTCSSRILPLHYLTWGWFAPQLTDIITHGTIFILTHHHN